MERASLYKLLFPRKQAVYMLAGTVFLIGLLIVWVSFQSLPAYHFLPAFTLALMIFIAWILLEYLKQIRVQSDIVIDLSEGMKMTSFLQIIDYLHMYKAKYPLRFAPDSRLEYKQTVRGMEQVFWKADLLTNLTLLLENTVLLQMLLYFAFALFYPEEVIVILCIMGSIFLIFSEIYLLRVFFRTIRTAFLPPSANWRMLWKWIFFGD